MNTREPSPCVTQQAAKSIEDEGIEKYPLLLEHCRELLSDEVIMN